MATSIRKASADDCADFFQSQHLHREQRKSSGWAARVTVVQEDSEVPHVEASREVASEDRLEDVLDLAIGEEERHEVEVAFQAGEELLEAPAPTSRHEGQGLAEGEVRWLWSHALSDLHIAQGSDPKRPCCAQGGVTASQIPKSAERVSPTLLGS